MKRAPEPQVVRVVGPFAACAAAALVAAAGAVACAASVSTLDVGTVGSDGGTAMEGSLPFGDAAADVARFGDGTASPYGCSGDLQNVVDGNGNVVQSCAPSKGCYAGECIDACTAAAKSQASIGCDFVLPTADMYMAGPGSEIPSQPCFAAFVANNWPTAVHVAVARGGQTFDVSVSGRIVGSGTDATQWSPITATGGLPQNEVGVVFLSHDPTATSNIQYAADGGTGTFSYPLTCPVTPAVAQQTCADAPTSGGWLVLNTNTRTGQAFHITTDYPVSLYDIMPYGGAMSFLPSATMVLPTSAWGTQYVVTSVPQGVKATSSGYQYIDLVAATDNTTVKLTPNVALAPMNGFPGADAGQTVSISLSAGEYLHIENPSLLDQDGGLVPYGNDAGTQEMSGSIVTSNQPIGLVTGDTALFFATSTNDTSQSPNGGAADSTHQQLPPVQALGWEYVAAPYPTRRADLMPESIAYRVVGAADGTQLTYDPPVPGAPTTLALGQRADFTATSAFHVASQDKKHPFVLTQLMSGGDLGSTSRPGVSPGLPIFSVPGYKQAWLTNALGDPEFVVVFPPQQYLTHYAFVTDPTYGTSSLVFVRSKGAGGFAEVTLDCAGKVGGWQAVGTGGQYQYAQVDLVRAGASVGSCANGAHVATSPGAFGLVVWGVDAYSSYGYPAGGNVGTINDAVLPTQ